MKIPSTLSRAALLLSAGALLVGNLGAITIDFNTTSSCFAANFGGTSCAATPGVIVYSNATTGDTATLTFTPATSMVSVPANVSSNIGFGTFQLTFAAGQGDPNNTGTVSIPEFTFLLNIDQTLPYAYNYPEVAVTISGSTANNGYVGFASSNLQAAFTPLSVTDSASEDVYSIVPAVQLIPEYHSNNGQLTIQGQLQTTGVPEPGTISLMGLSFAGIGFLVYRRRKNAPSVV